MGEIPEAELNLIMDMAGRLGWHGMDLAPLLARIKAQVKAEVWPNMTQLVVDEAALQAEIEYLTTEAAITEEHVARFRVGFDLIGLIYHIKDRRELAWARWKIGQLKIKLAKCRAWMKCLPSDIEIQICERVKMAEHEYALGKGTRELIDDMPKNKEFDYDVLVE